SSKAPPILTLLTVSLCLLTISTETAVAQHTTQFHATGVGVTGVLDSGNNTTINVEVVRNGSPGQSNESTFMLLDYFNETSTSFTEIAGGGNIPNGDLTGDSSGHMALSADLSQLTGFSSCTTDFTNNNTVTCTNNPTGMISMSW